MAEMADAIQVCQKLSGEHFRTEADMDQVFAIRRTQRDLNKSYAEQQKEMAQAFKELTRTVSGTKDSATRKGPINAHQTKLNLINKEEEIVKTNIQALKQEHQTLLEQKENVREMEKAFLVEQKKEEEEMIEVPKVKNELSLYLGISNIKWDYNSDHVRGFISSREKQKIKKFQLPPQMSEFDKANLLWDLIGEMNSE
mmetsp:Transcript_29273/g.40423  ORF Transcript_29273/g.40423 Transcript_29273/m.40423 type:complete len:198 (-) Transcript_29273:164-757(-)|eukprot:CAMPEP_0201478326 /NCGR_PEP_ID=MMETSP0151_2-20130828/3207_1 /ASSEMBLY_ACC=CAM_ASM_000257 /TAXON_ID=200890 /ORGANISM="Paramoeba atlantica, Strain 621/1 / CCAP 1560/9" /LENGTH=197 /DNA_ID=CAMNT_0047859379 /DNA_START=90 /DNA_END=683 /DNA_ORIENTATION=-